jgi:transcriptional regulator with XRE-family HTH domain
MRKTKNVALADFFKNEVEKLLMKFRTTAAIANQIGVSRSLIHTYIHGKSSPTLSTILKIGTLNESVTGEKIESFTKRWCDVYHRIYPGKNMGALTAILRREPLYKVHTTNLAPMIQLLATLNLETIMIPEIEYLLVTEERIGYKLNTELAVNLLKLRHENKPK